MKEVGLEPGVKREGVMDGESGELGGELPSLGYYISCVD